MPAPIDNAKPDMSIEEIEKDFESWENMLFLPENPPVLDGLLKVDKAVGEFIEKKLKDENIL